MLHMILVILKIVGILLVAILLLALLAVCSVLFIPLRYRLSAAKDGTEIRAWCRAGWMLHLVSVTAEYRDGKAALGVRILFLKKNLLPGEKEPPKQKGKRKKKPETPGKSLRKKEIPEKKEEVHSSSQEREQVQEIKKVSDDRQETKTEEPYIPERKKEKASPLRIVIDRLKEIFDRIKKFWEKLKDIPRKIRQTAEQGREYAEKLNSWISFLRSDMVKAVFCRFKRHFMYLWKHLKPDKLWGGVHYGFEDPSLTGQLTGMIYMLLPVDCYDIRLTPDFDSAVCEGEIHIKGHIRICHLARIGWKVFRDKEFRTILKKFQS